MILNGIGSRLVKNRDKGEIAPDRFRIKPFECDAGDLRKTDPDIARQTADGAAGCNGMGSAGEQGEHPEGVIQIFRLTEDTVFEFNHGIRADDQILREASRSLFGFPERIFQSEHHPGAVPEFFGGGRPDRERNSQRGEQFPSARGCGCQDQIHSRTFSTDCSDQAVRL